MRVFKIERTENIKYDQFTDCVVIAENEDRALEIAIKTYYQSEYENDVYNVTKENAIITEITLDNEGAVLGNYLRG